MRTQKSTVIIRCCNCIRNNIKATWFVLNSMIKKSVKKEFPMYFEKNDGSIIQNTEEIVNEFNAYFVNVMPYMSYCVEV